jgi:6,7-dimethyl-8-ribityllumazine synthase
VSDIDGQLPPLSPAPGAGEPGAPAAPTAAPAQPAAPAEPAPIPDERVDQPATDEPVSDEPASDGDPFEGWPAAESAAVIEEAPVDTSVEHVRGEIDVPDGYTVLEGTPLGNKRSVGVVVSRFNGGVTNLMLQNALDALIEAGVSQDGITVMPVPGAFELPLAAMALAKTRRYAAIVALGAIVRGDTPHFEFVAAECASGLQLAGIETGVPVSFGVLTVETVEQAEARVGKAAEAVRSALEMADLFARLRASARQ